MSQAPKSPIEKVRDALLLIERHHIALNQRSGRPLDESFTISCAREGLAALEELKAEAPSSGSVIGWRKEGDRTIYQVRTSTGELVDFLRRDEAERKGADVGGTILVTQGEAGKAFKHWPISKPGGSIPRDARRRAAAKGAEPMTLEEARAIVASKDASDPARVLEAVATVLRLEGIADSRFSGLANELEGIAEKLKEPSRG